MQLINPTKINSLCLFCSFAVVAEGNLSKCELNSKGQQRLEVKLKQWRLNHLSKVGEYMNGYLQKKTFLTLFNAASFCL